jgi:hypothetical protein
MAVKAMFAIERFIPDSVAGNYRIRVNIWSGPNNIGDLDSGEEFTPTQVSTTVNDALHTFVENWIQDNWSVSFNPLVDSVKCLNPVSLL